MNEVHHHNLNYSNRFDSRLLDFSFCTVLEKPGDAVLAGFGCTVLIAFIAEHINNYLVRRKK